jgi:hypothetical protein
MAISPKTVLIMCEGGEGAARPLYRALYPARALQNRGWKTIVANVMYEQEDHTYNGWIPGEAKPQPTPSHIIMHTILTPKAGSKPGSPFELEWSDQADTITIAKNAGQFVFMDLDDDIWNLPPWNPQYGSTTGVFSNTDRWVDNINSASGLIVSTPSIAKSARSNGVTVPITILRNAVTGDRIRPFEDHSPLRLGYVGVLGYRSKDFEVCINALYEALEGQRGEVEFHHLGADLSIGRNSIRDILPKFPVDIVEIPWTRPIEFQRRLTDIDCAILPAAEHNFNNGRSNVVGLECAAAGVPFIASPIAEYLDLACLVVCPETTKDWSKSISLLLDSEYRAEWRKSIAPQIVESFNTEDRAVEYENCLTNSK